MGLKVKDVTLFNLDQPGQSKVVTSILMLRTVDESENDRYLPLRQQKCTSPYHGQAAGVYRIQAGQYGIFLLLLNSRSSYPILPSFR